jgi:hypothetical protein
MPGAGHLVHMPSHIWYRIGRWRESLVHCRDERVPRNPARPPRIV